MNRKIKIFNIQHFSTGDGDGIRTTVFFSGCNLVCPWCHNPEALYGIPDFKSVDEIIDEVLGDIEFYEYSAGGVTLSGGEPFCDIEGCIELLKALKKENINTLIDTALSVDNIDLDTVCGMTDCFFVDIKTADSEKFRDICGGDLSVVIENLKKLISHGAKIVLRVPLIPDFNDDDESICNIINLIKPFGLPFTILPYHRLGSGKYKNLGVEYKWADAVPPTDERIAEIRQKFFDNNLSEADV